jgi:hypothetical protein
MTSRAVYFVAERVRREQEQLARDMAELELRQNATPQTMRNRRISVTDELFNRDKLTLDQLRAAREIHDILSSISRGLSTRTSSFEPRIRGGYTEGWQPGLSRAYQERYIPWRDEAGKTRLRSKASVADLVLDVVLSNFGLTQAGKMWGMDPRRVLSIMRTSLYRYGEIAGWVRLEQFSLNAGADHAD